MRVDKSAFEELRLNRQAYVTGLRRNKGFEAGILRLLTQLYPDNAHFIYELLQNAEDARATHARFRLAEGSLIFEHDGSRLFSARDIESITSIGDSTKADSPTEIGKFGVGFKAVFAYTQTPEVHSGDYHFRISDLVVPELIAASTLGDEGFKTQFVFPFDHPKKSSAQAGSEIQDALRALNDATLLFLSSISRISYSLPDQTGGFLERAVHPDLLPDGRQGEHITVSIHSPKHEVRRSDWLRYQRIVTIDDEHSRKECSVAVAFGLQESEGRTKKSLWKLVPLSPGRVCIYFPAEKEASNLRFHMHAPFASTVARDSLRDSPGNKELLSALATLAADSMEDIRDRGMLSVPSLEVLPIDDDNLSPFYAPVQQRILEAFRSRDLVPTKSGSHRKVDELFRGPSDIITLIDDDDLVILTGNKLESPLWCANPPQVNQRADKFLDALGIQEWEWLALCRATNCAAYMLRVDEDPQRPERLGGWLAAKEDAWLRRFYALLNEADNRQGNDIEVAELALVRVQVNSSTTMVKPVSAFFPSNDKRSPPPGILFVSESIYSSGHSEVQKNSARHFLEKAGVRVFDEEVEIAQSLALYRGDTFPDRNTHFGHINRFIAFLKNFPLKKQIFAGKKIFLGNKIDIEHEPVWCRAANLYLDSPFQQTGLTDLAATLDKRSLWAGYRKLNAKKGFVDFARALGVQTDLPIVLASTKDNPAEQELRAAYNRPGSRWMDSAINIDWMIKHLDTFVTSPRMDSSRLIWERIISASPEVATAKFRPNASHTTREAESQLIYWLKNNAWIPDAQGGFQKPQDISRDQLLQGFLYDDRNGLLSAIGFEDATRRESADYQRRDLAARDLGFDDAEAATEIGHMMRELNIPRTTLRAILKQHYSKPEQPEEQVPNPARRQKHVVEHRENAPDKFTVQRERSIQPHQQAIVVESKAYLRSKYTNPHGQMVCQACANEMPFKLPSGEYYFEAVQVLKGLKKHYFESRLAMCPTCAAMYQFARGTSDDEMRAAILAIDREQITPRVELPLVLADEARSLQFVGTHFFDLQIVISEGDVEAENSPNSNST
jgi:hypothetical protein